MNSVSPVAIYWFKRWGWVYRPIHPFGYLTTLAALVFGVQVFVVLDAHAHSATDQLYQFYGFAAPTFLGWAWIGSRTSGENRGGGQ